MDNGNFICIVMGSITSSIIIEYIMVALVTNLLNYTLYQWGGLGHSHCKSMHQTRRNNENELLKGHSCHKWRSANPMIVQLSTQCPSMTLCPGSHSSLIPAAPARRRPCSPPGRSAQPRTYVYTTLIHTQTHIHTDTLTGTGASLIADETATATTFSGVVTFGQRRVLTTI